MFTRTWYHRTRNSDKCTLHGQTNVANIFEIEGEIVAFQVGAHRVILLFSPQANRRPWSGVVARERSLFKWGRWKIITIQTGLPRLPLMRNFTPEGTFQIFRAQANRTWATSLGSSYLPSPTFGLGLDRLRWSISCSIMALMLRRTGSGGWLATPGTSSPLLWGYLWGCLWGSFRLFLRGHLRLCLCLALWLCFLWNAIGTTIFLGTFRSLSILWTLGFACLPPSFFMPSSFFFVLLAALASPLFVCLLVAFTPSSSWSSPFLFLPFFLRIPSCSRRVTTWASHESGHVTWNIYPNSIS